MLMFDGLTGDCLKQNFVLEVYIYRGKLFDSLAPLLISAEYVRLGLPFLFGDNGGYLYLKNYNPLIKSK